jgi:hypothetical protein
MRDPRKLGRQFEVGDRTISMSAKSPSHASNPWEDLGMEPNSGIVGDDGQSGSNREMPVKLLGNLPTQ